MPSFFFRVIDAHGRRRSGHEDANTSAALTWKLEQRGYFILEVEERNKILPVSTLNLRHSSLILEMVRALSALLQAGFPLPRALDAVAKVSSSKMRGIVVDVREAVQRGIPLAAAFSAHPAYFSPHFIGLIRSGERSGDLGGAVQRLAGELERENDLRSRLVSISIYPLLLALLGSIAVAVLLTIVLPRFAELLGGAGATVPRSTRLLLSASILLQRFWLLDVVVGTASLSALAWGVFSIEGRRAASRILLALPLVGDLRREAIAGRFARLTGVLLSSGAPLLSALDDTVECVADPTVKEEVRRIRSLVREGRPVSQAISDGDLFPPLLSQLLEIGEEAGQLPKLLLKAAELFDAKVERTTQRIVALLEPAMILIFGSIVGVIALSLLQAIYGINASAFR